MVEQLRTAKKNASAIAKAKSALAAKAGSLKGFGATGAPPPPPPGEEGKEEEKNLRDVPEWVIQQLPDLLRLLEACRLLSNVSSVDHGWPGLVEWCPIMWRFATSNCCSGPGVSTHTQYMFRGSRGGARVCVLLHARKCHISPCFVVVAPPRWRRRTYCFLWR